MSRKTLPIWLACTLALVSAPSVSRATQAGGEETIIRELVECTYVNGVRLPAEKVDYARLVACIGRGLELSNKPPGLWRKVALQRRIGPRDPTLYDILSGGVFLASELAPDQEGRNTWLRQQLNLIVRMLRDPTTIRVYNDPNPDRSEASDWFYTQRLQGRGSLEGTRARQLGAGLLSPHDWGFYRGINWIDDPGAVLHRDGTAFVELEALRRGGIPVRSNAASVWAVHDKRRAAIPVGAGFQLGGRHAFRDARGRVYVPVEEFRRQKLFDVLVHTRSQVVEMWLWPPHDEPR